jgi:hypothetical protein
MYKLIKGTSGKADQVQRLSDTALIPMSEDNTDYQQYLKWLEEGNQPLPAEE